MSDSRGTRLCPPRVPRPAHRRGALVLACSLVGCASPAPWGRAVEVPPARAGRTIDIAITPRGFDPRHVVVAAGETVRLVFTRTVARTCVTRVIVRTAEDRAIERDLPHRVPVAITLRFDRTGELGFHCPMAMYGGTIEIRGRPSGAGDR